MQKVYVELIGVIRTRGHDPFICTSCTRIMVKGNLVKLDMFAQYPLGVCAFVMWAYNPYWKDGLFQSLISMISSCDIIDLKYEFL